MIRMSFRDIEVVLLSSAGTADASFNIAIRSADFDVAGNLLDNVNIAGQLCVIEKIQPKSNAKRS